MAFRAPIKQYRANLRLKEIDRFTCWRVCPIEARIVQQFVRQLLDQYRPQRVTIIEK